jgi:hypothetical protein
MQEINLPNHDPGAGTAHHWPRPANILDSLGGQRSQQHPSFSNTVHHTLPQINSYARQTRSGPVSPRLDTRHSTARTSRQASNHFIADIGDRPGLRVGPIGGGRQFDCTSRCYLWEHGAWQCWTEEIFEVKAARRSRGGLGTPASTSTVCAL